MVKLSVEIEPNIRVSIGQFGEIGSYKINGFNGSITIIQEGMNGITPHILEWHNIQGDTSKEVAKKQLMMLGSLKEDIDKLIDKIEKALNDYENRTC